MQHVVVMTQQRLRVDTHTIAQSSRAGSLQRCGILFPRLPFRVLTGPKSAERFTHTPNTIISVEARLLHGVIIRHLLDS